MNACQRLFLINEENSCYNQHKAEFKFTSMYLSLQILK